MKASSAACVLAVWAAAVYAVAASPLLQPAPVYGPPGAYRQFQLSRTVGSAPAPFPVATIPAAPGSAPGSAPRSAPDYLHALSPPPPPSAAQAPTPSWSIRPPPQQQQQQGFQRTQSYQQQAAPPPQSYFRQLQLQQQQQSYQQQHPQQVQQQQQQYRTELQGLWRYSAPLRAAPLREDEVPHQGLGATDSVTMPEMAPYDPLLLTGPAAAYVVRALADREPHYFPAFPHTRLVLSNQQKRLDNGLPTNRLGSIRLSSDFLRGD